MQIAQHGVLMLSLLVFLQAIGLPVPCAIALILAAAQSATRPSVRIRRPGRLAR